MGYKYPNGTENIDSIITDVIATVAYIDLVLQVKLAHAKYPVKMSSRVSENPEQHEKFENYLYKHVEKLSYREKIDEFFKILISNDKQYRKAMKTLMIELGKIRNTVAHNSAFSWTDKDFDLTSDTVGAHMINKNYELFNEIFKRVKPFIDKIEESIE